MCRRVWRAFLAGARVAALSLESPRALARMACAAGMLSALSVGDLVRTTCGDPGTRWERGVWWFSWRPGRGEESCVSVFGIRLG